MSFLIVLTGLLVMNCGTFCWLWKNATSLSKADSSFLIRESWRMVLKSLLKKVQKINVNLTNLNAVICNELIGQLLKFVSFIEYQQSSFARSSKRNQGVDTYKQHCKIQYTCFSYISMVNESVWSHYFVHECKK